MNTLGHLLALRVTPANASERDQVAALATNVQAATGKTATLAYVGQRWTWGTPGTNPLPTRRLTGSPWRSLSIPEQEEGSYCCPGGGSSSDYSGGWPDSDG